MGLREDADRIIAAALRDALPDVAVRRELERLPEEGGRLVVVAIGKAAWQMAAAACDTLASGSTGAWSSRNTAISGGS